VGRYEKFPSSQTEMERRGKAMSSQWIDWMGRAINVTRKRTGQAKEDLCNAFMQCVYVIRLCKSRVLYQRICSVMFHHLLSLSYILHLTNLCALQTPAAQPPQPDTSTYLHILYILTDHSSSPRVACNGQIQSPTPLTHRATWTISHCTSIIEGRESVPASSIAAQSYLPRVAPTTQATIPNPQTVG